MSFQMMNDDVEIISKLGDEPNEDDGLDAAGLKAKFDEAATLLKAAHNALVGALNAVEAAESVGFDSDDIDGDNVKDAMENLRTYLLGQIQDVSQGSVADGSITTEKLGGDAVTSEKIAAQTLLHEVRGTYALTLVGTDATSASDKLMFYYVRALGMVFVCGYIEMVPSATGWQDAVYEFKYYEPTDISAATGQVALMTTQTDTEMAHLLKVNNSRVRLVVQKNAKAADVGSTCLIDVRGWYFCDGKELSGVSS